MERELLRKGLHTALAMFFAGIAPAVGVKGVVLLAIITLGVFLAARTFKTFSFVRSVARISYGELFFSLGVMFSIILAPHMQAFQLGMLVLGLADPFAAVVGMRYGVRMYTVAGEQRSYIGSATCFLICIGLFLSGGVAVFSAFIFASSLAAIEALAVRGSDNLLLPVTTVLLLTL